MPDYTVEAVLDMREWVGDHGTFHIYDVEFSGEQGSGKAEIKRKSTSPAPKAGDVIDAEIVTKGGRPELKRIWQENKPPASKGSGWQPKSPEEAKAINRAVAQKNAILLLGVEVEAGKRMDVQPAWEGSPASTLLEQRIDWLFADLEKVAGR